MTKSINSLKYNGINIKNFILSNPLIRDFMSKYFTVTEIKNNAENFPLLQQLLEIKYFKQLTTVYFDIFKQATDSSLSPYVSDREINKWSLVEINIPQKSRPNTTKGIDISQLPQEKYPKIIFFALGDLIKEEEYKKKIFSREHPPFDCVRKFYLNNAFYYSPYAVNLREKEDAHIKIQLNTGNIKDLLKGQNLSSNN